MRYVSGTKLDERVIRCDLDLGYREGRQFGRGKSGGQVSVFCPPGPLPAPLSPIQRKLACELPLILIIHFLGT